MRFNTKLFALLVLATFVILNDTACTQEKQNTEKPTVQATKSPAVPATPARISFVDKVSPATKGKAIDFTFKVDGKEVSFKDYTKNKVVFLNFWGTWCGPCRREIPDIIQVSKDLEGKDIVIIGIPQEGEIPVASAEAKVKAFAEKNGIPYLNIIDGKRELAKGYGGINAVPTTFIIDKKGIIAETIVGGRDKDSFMESIKRVLK